MVANHLRFCLNLPQMGNLALFLNKTVISAFGFTCLKHTRLASFDSIHTVSYKFYKYIEMYFSILKALSSNKILPFFNNNYKKINCIIIVNIYPQRIYYLFA